MSETEETEKNLAGTMRAEKAEPLRWIARDLGDAFPAIESTPGVVGGAARITRTRIPVWLLEQARRQGVSEAQLLEDYPTLAAADLANAWSYVRSHRQEIEAAIAANESDAGDAA